MRRGKNMEVGRKQQQQTKPHVGAETLFAGSSGLQDV